MQGEKEGVGKGKVRDQRLNLSDMAAINMQIIYVKCGKLSILHVNVLFNESAD